MKRGEQMKKILVLEDEPNIRSFVVINLHRNGYEPIEAENGMQALAKIDENPDLSMALLDVMLPDIDGFEVCRRIRATGSKIGIIMLTAKSQEIDKVTGLMTGADDYVTKPCSMELLICHIEAIMRRIMGVEDEQTQIFDLGGVKFDSVRQLLNDVHLSSRESELLAMLCRSKETVVSRSMILKTIWGYDTYFAARSLSVYVNHLRHFLEEAGCEYKIMAVHGKGYKIISPLS